VKRLTPGTISAHPIVNHRLPIRHTLVSTYEQYTSGCMHSGAAQRLTFRAFTALISEPVTMVTCLKMGQILCLVPVLHRDVQQRPPAEVDRRLFGASIHEQPGQQPPSAPRCDMKWRPPIAVGCRDSDASIHEQPG